MYLNARDRGSAICLFSALVHIEQLLNNKIIDEDLKDELIKAKERIEAFREELYKRLGDKFARSVANEVNDCELMLVRSSSPDVKKAREEVKKGILFREAIEEVGLNCFDCERDDFHQCKWFVFFDFFEHSGETKENICPFR